MHMVVSGYASFVSLPSVFCFIWMVSSGGLFQTVLLWAFLNVCVIGTPFLSLSICQPQCGILHIVGTSWMFVMWIKRQSKSRGRKTAHVGGGCVAPWALACSMILDFGAHMLGSEGNSLLSFHACPQAAAGEPLLCSSLKGKKHSSQPVTWLINKKHLWPPKNICFLPFCGAQYLYSPAV